MTKRRFGDKPEECETSHTIGDTLEDDVITIKHPDGSYISVSLEDIAENFAKTVLDKMSEEERSKILDKGFGTEKDREIILDSMKNLSLKDITHYSKQQQQQQQEE